MHTIFLLLSGGKQLDDGMYIYEDQNKKKSEEEEVNYWVDNMPELMISM